MVDGHVGPDVSHLLLARAPHFLHVVEVLLDGGSVGERFENLRDADLGMGAEEGVLLIELWDGGNGRSPRLPPDVFPHAHAQAGRVGTLPVIAARFVDKQRPGHPAVTVLAAFRLITGEF